MDPSSLRTLIEQVASGECTPDDAVRQLRRLPYADLGFARVDHHRDLRQGIPEAVYGPARRPSSAPPSSPSCWGRPGPVLLTRATEDQAKATSAATEALGDGPGRSSGPARP